jgi:soluble lytic murein transglycosylase-like protein
MKWLLALLAPLALVAQTQTQSPAPKTTAGQISSIKQTPPQPAIPADEDPEPEPVLSPAELQRAAIERQRAAVQQQAQNAGARLKPWGATITEVGPGFESAKPECEALAESVALPLVENAARTQGVDSKLLRAVVEQESGFHPCAISPKGAQGLMQLMPATADDLDVTDPFDPKQNIEAGAKYLKQMLDKNGGDVAKALAAYNAGPNAIDPASRIPETKSYVDAILTKLGIKRTDPPSIQTPKPIGN